MRSMPSEYVGLLLVILWSSVSLTVQCPYRCRCRDANVYVNCSGQLLKEFPDLPTSTSVLDLSGNSLGPVLYDSDIFSRMPNLTYVDISNNGLEELQGCLFRGLRRLRTVVLRSNRLARLPDNFFTDSKQVEHLDLSRNELAQLPGGIMSDMPVLKFFDVSHNRITELKLTARFQVPKDIEFMDFSHNNITTVTDDSFDIAREWSPLVNRTIRLRFCGLRNLAAQGLSKIPSITSLDLTGNPGVPVQALNDMLKNLQTSKRLQNLTLSEMNLGSINSLFTDVTELSLKRLNLSRNGIQDVADDVFQNLPSIQVMDASFNRLPSLQPGFKSLHSLRVLNLSNNRLSSFKGEQSDRLAEVLHLDLSHNSLSGGDSVNLTLMTKLETLVLSHNQLSSLVLPRTTGFLKHLDYRNNNVKTINKIEAAPLLRYFDLSGNKLSSLPALLFKDGKYLQVANFSSNNISYLHEQTFMPQSPLVVDLSHNALTQIKQVKWVATQRLDLRRNKISVVDPQAFKGMSGLEYLDMSSNNISDIYEDLFQHHISLQHLDLSRNAISAAQWPLVLRNLESLVHLDLSSNKLKVLPDHMLERVNRLEKVYLQNNYIAFITPMIFRDLSSLQELDLSGNPFDCSCDMQAFRDWVKRKSSIITGVQDVNSTSYRCHSPSSRSGVHITLWDTGYLECNRSMLYAIIFGCIGLGLLLVGAAASAAYRFYKRYQRRRAEWKQKLEEKLEEDWKNKKKADYIRNIKQDVADEIWKVISKKDKRGGKYQPMKSNGYVSDSAAIEARRNADKDRRYRQPLEKNKPRYWERPSLGQESDYVNIGRYYGDGYGNRSARPYVDANYRKESADSRVFYTADSSYRNRPGRHYPAREPVWQDREGWEWSKNWMQQERDRRPDHRASGYTTLPHVRGRDAAPHHQTQVYNDHYQPEVRFNQDLPRRHQRPHEQYSVSRSRSYNYLPHDYRTEPAAARRDYPDATSGKQLMEDTEQGEKGGGRMGRAVSQPYISGAGVSDWL